MLFVPDTVGSARRMVATECQHLPRKEFSMGTHLTCSLINWVVPVSSSPFHLPRNSSPRNGFSGFFSLPSLSLRLAYCCFSVLKNHLRTRAARLAGSGSRVGATKSEGCSVQYAEYSVRDVDERMNGGAVREDRSPLKDAMD